MRRVLICLLALWSSSSLAAITIGNTCTVAASGGNSLTCSLNNNGDTVRVALGIYESGDIVTGVTYGGVAMTKVYETAHTGAGLADYDYILTVGQGAPTGTNAVVISTSTSITLAGASAHSYTGVNQSTPTRAYYLANTNSDSNPTLPGASIAQVAGDLIVGSAFNFCATQSSNPSPQVNDQKQSSIGGYPVSYYADHNPATGSTGLGWTGTGSCGATQWAAGAYALIPAPAPSAQSYLSTLRSAVNTLIQVGSYFLGTTVPIAPPAPVVTINVTPSSMLVGASATLMWSATNSTSCVASGAWSGSKASSGSTSVSPSVGFYSYTLTCTGTGGSAFNSAGLSVMAPSVQFPRIAWANAGYHIGDAPSVAASLHADVAFISDNTEGGAAANGYNRNTVVNAIHVGDGAVKPIVLQYVLDSYFTPPTSQNGPVWSAQMSAMSSYWFVYRTDISPTTHATTGDPGNPWLTNPVDLGSSWEDGNGNNMEAAFAKYSDDLFRTGSTADAAANLDGYSHDNIWSGVPGDTYGNYLHYTGAGSGCVGPYPCAVTPGLDATAMTSLRAGQAKFTTWLNNTSNAPLNPFNSSPVLVVGNVDVSSSASKLSDAPTTPMYQRAPSAFTSLYGTLDGAQAEDAFGPGSIEQQAGFEQTRVMLAYYNNGLVKNQNLVMVGHHGIDGNGEDAFGQTVGQALRYGLCGTLVLTNGVYLPYEISGWFDYTAVNPANGIALGYGGSTSAQIGAVRYWLGTPIDPIQTGPTQGTAYARRFRMPNGRTALVLENPSCNANSGCGAATINLSSAFGGNWTRVTASGTNLGSNPGVDSGATVTGPSGTVTVQPGDGEILIQ